MRRDLDRLVASAAQYRWQGVRLERDSCQTTDSRRRVVCAEISHGTNMYIASIIVLNSIIANTTLVDTIANICVIYNMILPIRFGSSLVSIVGNSQRPPICVHMFASSGN